MARRTGGSVWWAAACVVLAACGEVGDPGPDHQCTDLQINAVANEGWPHVPEGSPLSHGHNPPASGQHYPVWARYQAHAQTVFRGYWVHNLEHGAIVFLHRPDAPAETVAALREVYEALPDDPACGHPRALLTADPLLPRPVAVVAANFVLEAGCVDTRQILEFVEAHRGRGPENVCADGQRP